MESPHQFILAAVICLTSCLPASQGIAAEAASGIGPAAIERLVSLDGTDRLALAVDMLTVDLDAREECRAFVTTYGVSSFVRRSLPALIDQALHKDDGLTETDLDKASLSATALALQAWRRERLGGNAARVSTSAPGLSEDQWAAAAFVYSRQGESKLARLAVLRLLHVSVAREQAAFVPVALRLPEACAKPTALQARHGSLLPPKELATFQRLAVANGVQLGESAVENGARLVLGDLLSGDHSLAVQLAETTQATIEIRTQLTALGYQPRADLESVTRRLGNLGGTLKSAADSLWTTKWQRLVQGFSQGTSANTRGNAVAADRPGTRQGNTGSLDCGLEANPYTKASMALMRLASAGASVNKVVIDSGADERPQSESLLELAVNAEFARFYHLHSIGTVQTSTEAEIAAAWMALQSELGPMLRFADGNRGDILNGKDATTALATLEKQAESLHDASAGLTSGLAIPVLSPDWEARRLALRDRLRTATSLQRLQTDLKDREQVVNPRLKELGRGVP